MDLALKDGTALAPGAGGGSRKAILAANIVAPGRIATNRIRFLDEEAAKCEGRSAEAVTFSASDRVSCVTGPIVRVDGGLIGSV